MPLVNSALLASLLSWAALLVHQPVPPAPDVRIVPQAEVVRLACGRACPVLAIYTPEHRIYLSDTVNLETLQGRSVLVHELVHHIQDLRAGGPAADCPEAARREAEAYGAQLEYVVRNGGLPGSWLERHPVICPRPSPG